MPPSCENAMTELTMTDIATTELARTELARTDLATMELATSFTLNGKKVGVSAAPHVRLSRVLRDELKLTGTKVGCDAGDCGACTVLVDGEAVCACLIAVAQVEDRAVETVEGLTRTNTVTGKLQASFLHHGAAQCGICTPGMLAAATALLQADPSPS